MVTPWLIDVVAMEFDRFLHVLNRLLQLGGAWINHGPLGFNGPVLAGHYPRDEVVNLVEKSGFDVKAQSYESIPYMQNPASNSHRQERTFTFSATKTKDIPHSESNQTGAEMSFDWEADHDIPVKLAVQEMRLVGGHLFNAEVLTMVDGQASFRDIQAKIVAKRGLPEEHAGYLLTQILRNAEVLLRRNPHRG
ncbi:MAG: hypothetical protein C5B49_10055 [Bdellovibrio sp.]|nr:MAG: hypothetical protein C5B49_10055 [Bdellovibrio sp.]